MEGEESSGWLEMWDIPVQYGEWYEKEALHHLHYKQSKRYCMEARQERRVAMGGKCAHAHYKRKISHVLGSATNKGSLTF